MHGESLNIKQKRKNFVATQFRVNLRHFFYVLFFLVQLRICSTSLHGKIEKRETEGAEWRKKILVTEQENRWRTPWYLSENKQFKFSHKDVVSCKGGCFAGSLPMMLGGEICLYLVSIIFQSNYQKRKPHWSFNEAADLVTNSTMEEYSLNNIS